jgi:uncharacterized membrane protein YgdD (TMEM256/DUF423 family)
MRVWLFLAALFGGTAVALGAFAAHGLSNRLSPQALTTFETGARYQMYHALAIGLAALTMRATGGPYASLAAIAFLVGIVLFSGSLYLQALTGSKALVLITPLGGLAFLIGWGCLAAAALRLS